MTRNPNYVILRDKMIKVEIQRLFHGVASVRDYQVNQAIEKDEPLQIILGDRYMILTPAEIKERGFKLSDKSFNSRFSHSKYKLIDFRWHPNEVLE